MKRIIASIMGTVAIIAMCIFGTTSPAAASSGGTCWDYAYQLGSSIRTCVQLTWIKQPDGTGIILTSISHSTPNRCDRLESSGGRYTYGRARIKRDLGWSTTGCNGSGGFYETGLDYGPTDVSIWMEPRINNGTDYTLGLLISLYADGSIRVLDKAAIPHGECC